MEKQHKYNVSLHIDTLGDDMRHAIALTAELGYAGITVGIGHPQLNAADFGVTARRHWMAILHSHHLALTAIRTGAGVGGCTDWSHAEILIQQTHRAIDLARECRAHEVLVYLGEPPSATPSASPTGQSDSHPGVGGNARGPDIAGGTAADAVIDELLSAADRASVKLVFSSGNAHWLKSKIKPHHSKSVGAALDSYRVLAAGQSPADAAGELAGIIHTWIGADALRHGGVMQNVLLGTGQGDLHATLRALDDQYFSGPMIVDIRGLADPAGAARHAVQTLMELLAVDRPTPVMRG